MTDHKSDYAGGYQRQKGRGRSALWTAVVIVVVIVFLVALNEYFLSVSDGTSYAPATKTVSPTIDEIRNAEDEILSSYKLLDSTAEQYRIPIDRAIELVAEEASKKSPDK